jgi:L,D-peptidoglycan transpeptidase YkuD (ErfK/YbiS/YcfS/YnhG family)
VIGQTVRSFTTVALVAVSFGACHGADPVATTSAPRGGSSGSDAIAPLVADAATSAIIPATSQQLLTAIVPDWTSTTAELQLWQRDGAGWRAIGEAWPGVVGRTGTAWGVGLHGTGAPAGRDGPFKHEGDGKSPAGAFAIRRVYGYAPAPPEGTHLAYTTLADPWQCVDDPASKHYDEILDRRTVTVDWKSAEQMRRADILYTWVIDLGHNPARTPGDGSCIFLHVWNGPDSSTVGCTAMDEDRLTHLVAALDPSATYVLLPRAEYDALAGAWRLPARSRSAKVAP